MLPYFVFVVVIVVVGLIAVCSDVLRLFCSSSCEGVFSVVLVRPFSVGFDTLFLLLLLLADAFNA